MQTCRREKKNNDRSIWCSWSKSDAGDLKSGGVHMDRSSECTVQDQGGDQRTHYLHWILVSVSCFLGKTFFLWKIPEFIHPSQSIKTRQGFQCLQKLLQEVGFMSLFNQCIIIQEHATVIELCWADQQKHEPHSASAVLFDKFVTIYILLPKSVWGKFCGHIVGNFHESFVLRRQARSFGVSSCSQKITA